VESSPFVTFTTINTRIRTMLQIKNCD